jgi:predicted N-acyltransferase
VPFTPATGPRLLIRDSVDTERVADALAGGLIGLCDAVHASSVHVTFAREPETRFLAEHGFLLRTDRQFHWRNDGYATFEDFLATLVSRHRKAIRRERRDAVANGVTIHRLTGSDITEDAWDAFFEFYMETGSRKWGRPYLTRKFFSLIGETMANDVLLVMAKRNGRWIAGAINFIGSDTLFGRNWGAIEHHPFLHFEVCYYQAIEFAIARGLKTVEAGAQGEHKIARGYLPQTTCSAHYIANPSLRRAVGDYLKHERAYVQESVHELTEAAPFRKTDQDN